MSHPQILSDVLGFETVDSLIWDGVPCDMLRFLIIDEVTTRQQVIPVQRPNGTITLDRLHCTNW